ncbi:ribosomal RNA small subunit methyltransferase B [Lysobacter gummosus]|nr:ribosomal RNA small subunit methyltransferase B [Lysobacter gummosus]
MSAGRQPPKGPPRDGEARPVRGRVRDPGSLDAPRPAAAKASGERAAKTTGPERRAAQRPAAARSESARSDSSKPTEAKRRVPGQRGSARGASDGADRGKRSTGAKPASARLAFAKLDFEKRRADRRAAQKRGAGETAEAGSGESDVSTEHSSQPQSASPRSAPRSRPASSAAGARDPYARSRGAATRPPPLSDSAQPGAQSRAIAARVLNAVLHRGRSLKAELAVALPALADPRDRALVEAICFAVLRQPLRYEAALTAWMPRPLSSRDGELRALLYTGLAQLDPLQLAAHAALDATVEAARLLGHPHQAALVNALLRRAQREGLPVTDPRHSHWPSWLRGMLRKDWPEHYDAILANSGTPPPMWLRVNRARVAREDYLAGLTLAGIEASAPAAPADALRLDAPLPVAALPGFADGEVSVQDVSAQRVADALAPAPGARVLDACAAPGGKSAHLLERDPGLRLTALDIDVARLHKVRATLQRAGFDAAAGERIELRAADAADLGAWWDGTPFDAVLLDAPCSATGIVRRQPDVVLHRRESDIAALSLLQARLLDALWRTVAPGGVLLYATCSILRQENDAQVRAFVQRTADARVEPLDASYGHDCEVGRQRLPGEDGGDGFFYARLRRTG